MTNEKRLIDANELLENRDIQIVIGAGDNICIDVADIAKAPTVDAVEVVHGRWEKAEYYGYLLCNKCKDVYIEECYLGNGKWNYCPNCGAKMDGDGNGT